MNNVNAKKTTFCIINFIVFFTLSKKNFLKGKQNNWSLIVV